MKLKNFFKGYNKNKGFLIVCIAFIILFMIDLFVTLQIKYIQHIELNPAFKIGGFGLVVLINLFMWIFFTALYTRTKNVHLRYAVMYYFVTICLFRILVIWNNIVVLNTPITYEEAVSIPQEVQQAQLMFILLVNAFPLLCGFVTWFMFIIDHKVKIKVREKKKY